MRRNRVDGARSCQGSRKVCWSREIRTRCTALRSQHGLAAIVSDYIAHYRESARRELRYYATQRLLADAIREAGLSRLFGGKRHPHQRRIPLSVLKIAEKRLQGSANRLSRLTSFRDVHALVEAEIGSIHGIGALAVYDIAHRIGAYLKCTPDLVYLHAGTGQGARVFGLHGKSIHPAQLPSEFGALTAAEIEDCLCIYKNAFRRAPPVR